MPTFHPEQIADWLDASWEGAVPSEIIGISTDTRTLRPGELYLALQGEHFDGHQFISVAFEKGASGAIVSQSEGGWGGEPLLRVPDTLWALQELARCYRKIWTARVIGISGSVGKTMVKEMCAAVLAEAGKTHATKGNLNNHIGLPLSMLSTPSDAQFAIFEIGINHPGEMEPLAEILAPDVALLTELGAAHLENFSSVREIVDEKAHLLRAVPESGTVLLDRAGEWFDFLRPLCQGQVRTFALNHPADYSGSVSEDGMRLRVNEVEYALPLPGEHVMRNAMRAIALGLELGLEPDAIAQGLLQTRLPPMRWERSKINGITFINDAYNANPLSMRANLTVFAQLPEEGKKWVVVGGMRELGPASDAEHAALGHFIDSLKFDGVLCVGALAEGVVCEKTERFFHLSTPAEAARVLHTHLQPGDQVLLKASRGEHLEELFTYFKEY